jgi:hypothetical protein
MFIEFSKTTLSLSLFLITSSVFSSYSNDLQHPIKINVTSKKNSISNLTKNDLKELNDAVQGRLIIVESAYTYRYFDQDKLLGKSDDAVIYNPFYIEEMPGATQSLGWLNAWQSSISPIAVKAKTKEDVVNAIKFARKHKLKVVIKGAGHDYLGRSNSEDSLLIWTHDLKGVLVLEHFLPASCPKNFEPLKAVTVEAGSRWLEVYSEVTNKHGLYVQGGGCTSVGAVGGFTLGGGFGSFSRRFGTGASNLIEAEVVLASGDIVVANEFQYSDLFWALKGGGGNFGVVTKMTYRLHTLPESTGYVNGIIKAKDDKAYKKLIAEFIGFYKKELNNELWGESVSFNSDNTLSIHLCYLGIDEAKAKDIFSPFLDNLQADSEKKFDIDINFIAVTPSKLWSYDVKRNDKNHSMTLDNRPNVAKDQFWWTSNSNQISMYWYTYQSRWLPIRLFEEDQKELLAETLFKASRHTKSGLELHFNKGLANASSWAIESTKNTSINPKVLEAAGLIIIGSGKQGLSESDKDFNQDALIGNKTVLDVNKAMNLIKTITPNAGTYINESDYFLDNWQEEFFLDNYNRLKSIKVKYDPDFFFTSHFLVGS